jgi:hypothetical protein
MILLEFQAWQGFLSVSTKKMSLMRQVNLKQSAY